ncbi:hypothetical protein CALCODRAFT_521915 [Calocera cornea HHB12733]|uniref:Uncharacterized protein n=1 Tax=Calocera cornea HHB12733 TaxID=1353952 RepID=A0A165CB55_9BASI|nr:hypothetical protein CALCODRAFT_521915 [Calocera cornea HHB12733]
MDSDDAVVDRTTQDAAFPETWALRSPPVAAGEAPLSASLAGFRAERGSHATPPVSPPLAAHPPGCHPEPNSGGGWPMLAWLARLFNSTSMFRGDTQLELIAVLANSGEDIRQATKAIRIYIESKLRKNRSEEYVHQKLQDIENRYKFDTALHEAFHVARAQTGLQRSTVLPPARRVRRDSFGLERRTSLEHDSDSPRRAPIPLPTEPSRRPTLPLQAEASRQPTQPQAGPSAHPPQPTPPEPNRAELPQPTYPVYPSQLDTPRSFPPPAPQPQRRPSLLDTPRSFPASSAPAITAYTHTPNPSSSSSIMDTPRSFSTATPALTYRSSLPPSTAGSPNFPPQQQQQEAERFHKFSALMKSGERQGSGSSGEGRGLELQAGPSRGAYSPYAYPQEYPRETGESAPYMPTTSTPYTAVPSSSHTRRRTSNTSGSGSGTAQHNPASSYPPSLDLGPAAVPLDQSAPRTLSVPKAATPRSLMGPPASGSGSGLGAFGPGRSPSPSTASRGSPGPGGHSFGPRPAPPRPLPTPPRGANAQPNPELSPITPISPLVLGVGSTFPGPPPPPPPAAPMRHPTGAEWTISPEEEVYRRANY